MATKTFKIGLSTSDKSAMAQDVYERLIAMCFDEYDSTKTYNAGDFVVYENPADTFKLYKCKEDNVTGTWNSAKWELATFQDLVDDVEGAVASVDGKANVDGNYPTMTVGLADNLTPYDEESGDDQDEPFSFQATGTANGTQSDFATGSNALLREKQGHTLVVNQQIENWNFATQTRWSATNATISIANNTGTFTVSAKDGFIAHTVPLVKDHTYLLKAEIKLTTATTSVYTFIRDATNNVTYQSVPTQSSTNKQLVMVAFKATANVSNAYVRIMDQRESGWDAIQVSNTGLIDLTQMFNGDIPQDLLDHPEHFFRYYQGDLSYNTGTLVNANSQYIKCIGRQQWDEEWEKGIYLPQSGVKYSDNDHICSKNLIRVIPGLIYYFKGNFEYSICYYDKDRNFISSTTGSNTTKTIPSNCSYLSFTCGSTYGTTYNNDITISIYYEGESGYDQYYPYEVLTNTDTGDEVLRQAGSAKDYKTPDRVVHRVVGTLNLWEFNFTNLIGTGTIKGVYGAFSDGVAPANANTKANISSNKFVSYPRSVFGYDGTNYLQVGISIDPSGNLVVFINDNSVVDVASAKTYLQSLGAILYYELATPTTEQGTTFSPNLVIDDFGSMEFSGTSGVPQGNLIFYPVDYKAFVDTLYNYTEGTPSNIALKSDLSASESDRDTVDTQLLNAIGGTLRNCLSIQQSGVDFDDTAFVDLGTLDFSKDTDFTGIFSTNDLVDLVKKVRGNPFVSTLYMNSGEVSFANMPDMTAQIFDNGRVYFRNNTAYTNGDGTAFKAAMKGVLLAYEKA